MKILFRFVGLGCIAVVVGWMTVRSMTSEVSVNGTTIPPVGRSKLYEPNLCALASRAKVIVRVSAMTVEGATLVQRPTSGGTIAMSSVSCNVTEVLKGNLPLGQARFRLFGGIPTGGDTYIGDLNVISRSESIWFGFYLDGHLVAMFDGVLAKGNDGRFYDDGEYVAGISSADLIAEVLRWKDIDYRSCPKSASRLRYEATLPPPPAASDSGYDRDAGSVSWPDGGNALVPAGLGN